MENNKSDKIERVLGIYTKLKNGYLVSKSEEALNYGVNERSIREILMISVIILKSMAKKLDVSILLYMIVSARAIA